MDVINEMNIHLLHHEAFDLVLVCTIVREEQFPISPPKASNLESTSSRSVDLPMNKNTTSQTTNPFDKHVCNKAEQGIKTTTKNVSTSEPPNIHPLSQQLNH